MAELEASCGRLAAVRMSDAGLERLIEAHQRCKDAVEQEDAAAYYLENEAFHQEIYEAFHQEIYHGATNSYLQRAALKLQNRLKPYRRVQLRFRGRMGQSLAEHEEIITALTAGDGERAEKTLRAHVNVQGERFQQLMVGLKS